MRWPVIIRWRLGMTEWIGSVSFVYATTRTTRAAPIVHSSRYPSFFPIFPFTSLLSYDLKKIVLYTHFRPALAAVRSLRLIFLTVRHSWYFQILGLCTAFNANNCVPDIKAFFLIPMFSLKAVILKILQRFGFFVLLPPLLTVRLTYELVPSPGAQFVRFRESVHQLSRHWRSRTWLRLVIEYYSGSMPLWMWPY